MHHQVRRGSWPVDDVVEVVAPSLEAGVPAGRDVSDDVDLLPRHLGRLKFLQQPVELLGRIRGVDIQPPRQQASTVHVRKVFCEIFV